MSDQGHLCECEHCIAQRKRFSTEALSKFAEGIKEADSP
jgi:hypothetical protein